MKFKHRIWLLPSMAAAIVAVGVAALLAAGASSVQHGLMSAWQSPSS